MSTAPRKTPKPALKTRLNALNESLRRTGSTLKKLKPAIESVDTIKRRRIARRQASGLHFVLADRIDFVNAELWDSLAGASVFLSRDYLRVLETHGPDNVQPRYAMACDDAGRPVAVMLFQRVRITGDRLRKPGSRKLIDGPLKKLDEHLLVCGNLLVWGARAFAFAPDTDPALVWHGVGEAMYRLRRADKLHGESDLAMVKDFAAGDDLAKDSLRLLGYRHVETDPDMVLTLKPAWKTFDDYLASLTSSYRSSAKRLEKDCTTAGIVLRTVTAAEMRERQADLHDLYHQVHQAQGLRLASLATGYLPAMAEALGAGRFVCRVAERDGRWVGFITTVLDGNTAVGYYVGYDRPANADAPIYLALLQSTIADAIGFGATRLSLGRTALEPKAKMGCKPEPLACAVRHRVSALNWITTALTRTASHDEAPERSPFKQSEAAAPTA
ncbi:MAG: GNAT family N-acetyltransferase [Rhizobacter sp.]